MQYLGKWLLDPSLASLELTPSVMFFTTNNDPQNAATLEQNPLAKLEGHVTRNFGSALWVSLDALYGRGGETIMEKSCGTMRAVPTSEPCARMSCLLSRR